MLNIGMTELLCFSIIALLILGPEKLPEAARFAAKWYGKAKRLISNVQNDIDRELRLSELREQMQAEMQRIHELEEKMRAQMQELNQNIHDTHEDAVQTSENQKTVTTLATCYNFIHSHYKISVIHKKPVLLLRTTNSTAFTPLEVAV